MSKENNNNIEEDKKELKDSESDNSKKTNLSSEDKSLSGNDISSGKSSDANLSNPEKLNEESSSDNDVSVESGLKLPFIIGKKIGMSQIFLDTGRVVPVTVVEAGPCHVSQLKTNKNDGYVSVQLSFKDKKMKKTTKAIEGHFKKANITPKKHLKEFRYFNINDIELGSIINLNQFEVGDFLNVTGYSKGKGFAGHMKRHNFSGGRASHGKNSVMRKAGSIGAGTDPGRVWKGTRMAGRMGNDKVTVKNIQIVRLDESENLIFLKGAIPGPNNKIVYLNKD